MDKMFLASRNSYYDGESCYGTALFTDIESAREWVKNDINREIKYENTHWRNDNEQATEKDVKQDENNQDCWFFECDNEGFVFWRIDPIVPRTSGEFTEEDKLAKSLQIG